MTFLNTVHCFASQASSLPRETIIEIAENYEHIFIGTVIIKTVESDSTRYVFNVTEYLKHPLNSSEIFLTVGGGSEIAVSPSTSFFLGVEYLFFFDQIDESYGIVGFDYTYTLVNSVDADDIRVLKAMDGFSGGVNVADVADDYDLREPSNSKVLIYQITGFVFIGVVIFIALILILKRIRSPRTPKTPSDSPTL